MLRTLIVTYHICTCRSVWSITYKHEYNPKNALSHGPNMTHYSLIQPLPTPEMRHIRDHQQITHARMCEWQTGSILCLAWEQLLVWNWDHKSSLSTATPAAAPRCSMQGRRPELGGCRVWWKKISICSHKSWTIVKEQILLWKVACFFVIFY